MKLLRRPTHATVVAYLALFMAMSGTAVAATGGTAILGKWNSAGKATGLRNPNGPALRLSTPPGAAPMRVDGTGRVTNLNSDRLDGLDASAFLPSGGKATDADRLDGLDASAFLTATGKASDADRLDGQEASYFQRRLAGAYVLTTSFCPSGTFTDSTVVLKYAYTGTDKVMTLCQIY